MKDKNEDEVVEKTSLRQRLLNVTNSPEEKLALERDKKYRWYQEGLRPGFLPPEKNAKGYYLFEAHQLIEYTPNFELLHFVRALEKKIFYIIASLIAFFLLGSIFNLLAPLMKVMAHVFIAPFKTILVQGQADSHITLYIDLLGHLSMWGCVFIGLIFAALIFSSLYRESHIGLTNGGMYLLRKSISLSDESYAQTNWIAWNSIENVLVKRPKLKKSIKDYLIILDIGHGKTIELKFGDIYVPEERNYFISFLSEKVPAFNRKDLEYLKPADTGSSYTELWLNELSAPPKRDKLRPLEPGTILHQGKYRIINKIGIGGQGTVYLAHSTISEALSQELVLKEFVLPIFPDARVRRQAAERFQEEATLLSRLKHERIVKFYEIFIEDHRLYMAMEKIEGRTLEELVELEGPQSNQSVKALLLSMAEILAYLHKSSPPVIHRDFTPDNLMLSEDGTLKLIDFSVATEIQNEITGTVVGKMNYIAPEQFRGKATTKSDIYSLGATAYFLLTGEHPEAISRSSPFTVNPDNVDSGLDRIVKRCTEPDHTLRYQSVQDLIHDLKKLQFISGSQ